MEPNKLDKDFRKKLNERSIQPSEMSWDRLDAMLTVAEKKKPKRTWLYIAAGFFGFLLVGTLFFKQPQIGTNIDNAVVENEKSVEKPNDLIKKEAERETINIASFDQEAVASVQEKSKKMRKEESLISLQEEKFQEAATRQEIAVLESIEETKAPNKYIESENLLAEAETKIQSQSIQKYGAKSNVRVNSQNLLFSVEGEINDTFREKVIKSISKNYESVKTSLANRNHE